jgi:hypothetical protein
MIQAKLARWLCLVATSSMPPLSALFLVAAESQSAEQKIVLLDKSHQNDVPSLATRCLYNA